MEVSPQCPGFLSIAPEISSRQYALRRTPKTILSRLLSPGEHLSHLLSENQELPMPQATRCKQKLIHLQSLNMSPDPYQCLIIASKEDLIILKKRLPSVLVTPIDSV